MSREFMVRRGDPDLDGLASDASRALESEGDVELPFVATTFPEGFLIVTGDASDWQPSSVPRVEISITQGMRPFRVACFLHLDESAAGGQLLGETYADTGPEVLDAVSHYRRQIEAWFERKRGSLDGEPVWTDQRVRTLDLAIGRLTEDLGAVAADRDNLERLLERALSDRNEALHRLDVLQAQHDALLASQALKDPGMRARITKGVAAAVIAVVVPLATALGPPLIEQHTELEKAAIAASTPDDVSREIVARVTTSASEVEIACGP